ncbi:hypothetical protein [Vibrio penaeicida]|uniref:hypothetical protein n=1 Tax=Vibrio penaeicida TaxID=104609 RepID=UPI000CE9E93C|nr:hypothetical protein [Vibrio penaeicida]
MDRIEITEVSPISAQPWKCDTPMQWLRSLVMISQRNYEVAPYDDFLKWLKTYDQFFQESVGISKNRNIHCMYDRDVTFSGDSVVARLDEIIDVSAGIHQAGFGVSVTVEAAAFHIDSTLLRRMQQADSIELFCLVILATDVNTPEKASHIKAGLESLSRDKNIAFIASYSVMSQLNIFDEQWLNRGNIEWFQVNETMGNNTDTMMACFRRMKLCVDDDGLIYPCMSLVGLEEFCLGDIYQPLEETLLSNPKSQDLINQWATQGPPINEQEKSIGTSRYPEMPSACAAHLYSAFGTE